MSHIVSWNVNGIKAFCNHGGVEQLKLISPDFICLQEIKSNEDNFKYWISDLEGYELYVNSNSNRSGYAGVATLVKSELIDKIKSVNFWDFEETYYKGRVVELELEDCYLINVYTLNSGDKDQLRSDWDNYFRSKIAELTKPVIIVGDLNVVHKNQDYYKNLEYDRNKYPGLKDYERSNFDQLLQNCHLIDSFRELNPDSDQMFSWFSYRYNAFDNNHGWRLDYGLVSEQLRSKLIDSTILDTLRYSDHCPISLNILI